MCFTNQDDIILLQGVFSLNPFEEESRWRSIQEILCEKTGKVFTLRGVSERCDHLLMQFKNGDLKYSSDYFKNICKPIMFSVVAQKHRMKINFFFWIILQNFRATGWIRRKLQRGKERRLNDHILKYSKTPQLIHLVLFVGKLHPHLQLNIFTIIRHDHVPLDSGLLDYLRIKGDQEAEFRDKELSIKESNMDLEDRKIVI